MTEDENSSESCLHCEINEVVREHIDAQETVDIADLAARMAESLVELILLASFCREKQDSTVKSRFPALFLCKFCLPLQCVL